MEAIQHTDLEILSHNLLWLRKEHGYSQKNMAVILKIGVGSLRALERGRVPPRVTVDILFEIQTHFQIAPSVMLS